jgi:hypothetical protein
MEEVSGVNDERVQAQMVETELVLNREQVDAIRRYVRWNEVFFSPRGLQSLFPGLGPVKGKK